MIYSKHKLYYFDLLRQYLIYFFHLIQTVKSNYFLASSSNHFDYQEEPSEIKYIDGDVENNTDYLTTQEDAKYPVTDPKKPFVCQHCGVGFAREKALASHARIHGGDSPFECQKCGEMFWDVALMQVSKYYHSFGNTNFEE